MKRSVCAIMTAAAVTGCQSSGPTVIHQPTAGIGPAGAHGMATDGSGRPTLQPASNPAGPAGPVPAMGPQASSGRTDDQVVPVGYGTGFGVISNQRFQQ